MDEMFGENNRLGSITIVNKPEGRTDDKFIPTAHEYMLVYAKSADACTINKLLTYDEEYYDNYPLEDNISRYKLKGFRRGGANSRRQDRPNLYFPIFYNPIEDELSLTKENSKYVEILPIDSQKIVRCWRWGKQRTMENSSELVVKKVGNKWDIFVKSRSISSIKATTVWNSPKYNPSAHGTKLLEQILGKSKSFDYPKSIYAVCDALSMTTQNKSIVLDFFAGSGTTGQAVLELNAKDKGQRQFILCTNNENGICDNVCYPRVANVIKGYQSKNGKKVAALGGVLKYYRTDFVDAAPTDSNKKKLTLQATEMLCIKEGTYDLVMLKNKYSIFKANNHYTGIVFDQEAIDTFKENIKEIKGEFSIYIFSLGDDDFEKEFIDLKQKIKVKPIPESIMRVYRRIFK